jgi:hypothetical protein
LARATETRRAVSAAVLLLVEVHDRDVGALRRDQDRAARPIPPSPPVISARFPASLPLGRRASSTASGRGRVRPVSRRTEPLEARG